MQIAASVNYHVKKPTPQAFEFDVDGIVGNLVSPELVTTEIEVTDLRYEDQQPTFEHDGIEFISVHVDKVTRRWCYVALHPSQQQLL